MFSSLILAPSRRKGSQTRQIWKLKNNDASLVTFSCPRAEYSSSFIDSFAHSFPPPATPTPTPTSPHDKHSARAIRRQQAQESQD